VAAILTCFPKLARYAQFLTTLEELSISSTQLELLEILALNWITDRRSLAIGRFSSTDSGNIDILVEEAGRILALLTISIDQFLFRDSAFELLRETIIEHEIEGEYSADEKWFDSRNQRLGIYFDDRYEENVTPAHAMQELVLSYVLSSSGVAHLHQPRFSSSAPSNSFLQISLTYFVMKSERGWHEEHLVRKSDLLALLEERGSTRYLNKVH